MFAVLFRCMILHSAVLVEEGTCLLQLELMALLGCLILGKINESVIIYASNLHVHCTCTIILKFRSQINESKQHFIARKLFPE